VNIESVRFGSIEEVEEVGGALGGGMEKEKGDEFRSIKCFI